MAFPIATNCNKVIINVFGATVPRQRSSSVDEHILNLQRQTYEDTLPDHEYDTQLQNLVHSYQDIFETECTQPANIPPVHVDLKPEFIGKRFFHPEPLRSHKDQQTIDQDYKKLIEQGKANSIRPLFIIWDRLSYLDTIKMGNKLKIELVFALMHAPSIKL